MRVVRCAMRGCDSLSVYSPLSPGQWPADQGKECVHWVSRVERGAIWVHRWLCQSWSNQLCLCFCHVHWLRLMVPVREVAAFSWYSSRSCSSSNQEPSTTTYAGRHQLRIRCLVSAPLSLRPPLWPSLAKRLPMARDHLIGFVATSRYQAIRFRS
jgi:hypothetical protein